MPATHYDLHWLTQKVTNGELPRFLFFWGHTGQADEMIGKYCLSQWYPSPFMVDNTTYKTAEHWMMAQKALLFGDHAAFEKIIRCNKPGEAKALGREVLHFDEGIWQAQRFKIVKTGNFHKFSQDAALSDYLLCTDGRVLVEASPVDPIWGIGLAQESRDAGNVYAWRGLNLLGFALMEVRDLLKTGDQFTT